MEQKEWDWSARFKGCVPITPTIFLKESEEKRIKLDERYIQAQITKFQEKLESLRATAQISDITKMIYFFEGCSYE